MIKKWIKGGDIALSDPMRHTQGTPPPPHPKAAKDKLKYSKKILMEILLTEVSTMILHLRTINYATDFQKEGPGFEAFSP